MQAIAGSHSADGLASAIDVLTGEPLDGRPSHEIGTELVAIRRAIDRLEAEFVRRVHRFHEQRGAASEANVSTISWLRSNCTMSRRAAAHRVHVAQALGQLPAALGAACTGRASFTNVSMIARLAEDVGAEHVQPLEPILIAAAASLDPARMRIVTETTRLKLDPDGVLAEQNRAHEHRWFACDETYGGVFVLRGELDKEGGALLKTAIDSLSRSLSRDDMRTASQRRADALVDLAAQHLQSGDQAQVRGQRPHLTVTVDVATLQGRADAPPAVLEGVGPIHAAMAQRIACDAARTVVTVNGNGVSETAQHLATVQPQPLSIGRTTRTIPAHIRTALHLRDGGCRFPGCDRPPGWTDGHHVQHWADGGATALENLVSLCRRHHRVVHEEGWHIAIRDGGAVNSQPP